MKGQNTLFNIFILYVCNCRYISRLRSTQLSIFGERVDIEDLVMPFEPTVILNMDTIDIKEEPLEQSIDSVCQFKWFMKE